MKEEQIKTFEKTADGMKTYEFLVDNLEQLTDEQLVEIVNHLAEVDHSGQYLASGIRYLNGVDKFKYSHHIDRMVAVTIDKDREHKYISELMMYLYGAEYYNHITDFENDDNFRRMYKRLHPSGKI